jgi:predicted dehydrogenase
MTDRIGLAVIGVGRMGRLHAANAASLPGARLVAVCDVDPAAREWVAAELDVRALPSVEAVLERGDVDAVVVATTTRTHAQIGLTLEETDAVLQALVHAGLQFQIGFQRRWDPAFVAARRAIEAGAIGEPRLFKAHGRDPQPASLAYHDPANSGGIFLDAAIHDYDAARFLMGREVARVTAHGATLVHQPLATVGDVDTCVTVLEFQGGGLGVCEWNRFAVYGYDAWAEVQGPEGALRLGGLQQTALLALGRAGVSHDTMPGFLERFHDAYRAELAAFVGALREGRPASPGVEDARRALQIALRARESFQQGRTLDVAALPALT